MKQKECKTRGVTPSLITYTDQGNMNEVKVLESCIVLSGTIQRNLQWQAHLETGEELLLPALQNWIGTVKYLSRNILNEEYNVTAAGYDSK